MIFLSSPHTPFCLKFFFLNIYLFFSAAIIKHGFSALPVVHQSSIWHFYSPLVVFLIYLFTYVGGRDPCNLNPHHLIGIDAWCGLSGAWWEDGSELSAGHRLQRTSKRPVCPRGSLGEADFYEQFPSWPWLHRVVCSVQTLVWGETQK